MFKVLDNFGSNKHIFAGEVSESCIKLIYERQSNSCRVIKPYSDLDSLKNIVEQFIHTNNVKAKNTSFILNRRDTVLRCASLSVPPKEVGKALKYDLKQYILVDREEYIVDYKITQVVGNKTHILIAAIPRIIMSQYLYVFDSLSIQLTNVDVYQNCVAKLFSSEPNILVVSECDGRLQLIFLNKNIINGLKEIPFIGEDIIINEVSKLFDSFLTSYVFDSVLVLGESLQFLADYFYSIEIDCRIIEKADFLALESITC